jgi:CRP-like cAMP-binding protein
MAKKSLPQVNSRVAKVLHADGDGHPILNKILLDLPAHEAAQVFPTLEFMRLNTNHILHDAGETVRSAFFCNSGMISILTVLSDGKSVEVGLVGHEGFVGLPLVVGFRTTPTRAVVQIDATAFRMSAAALTDLLRRCPLLERRLQQFSQIAAMETTQIAACNRIHDVEERLSRWLLMCADRTGEHSLPLTQDLLSQMLGTRRASVTVAAGMLQKAGLIGYTRGRVEILNREKLQQATCDCYEAMSIQHHKWHSERT